MTAPDRATCGPDVLRSPGCGQRFCGDRGQSTAELALVLPVVFLALMGVVQIGVVVHDQVLVTHAAREAVRAASVSSSMSDAELRTTAATASGLDGSRLAVHAVSSGDITAPRVRVTVEFSAPTNVPMIGVLLPDLTLRAEAMMRREH